ncbi:DUF262 domain-containing protein [Enterocloster bolteae]|uniref:DUF262 domain-containing protein n=1 Tax=Enterocloster bolteae TaxID=208479 RepID=A0A412YUS2_9FIRM|nr:DUF262 domain-containing protein [Enterocloster bolteae]RGQ57969.1 DUF262 domain-containing protein [Enterocloster bolteae]RGV69970.1 DUF262 domain-containing protein [Enterocloster bolteae]
MKDYLGSTQQNIAWFNQRSKEVDGLIIKPTFQRNPVWTVNQKSYLIDSVLRSYPIPEIYLQEKVNDKGESQFVVVDGQQRLRAVLDFINNEFSLVPSETSEEWGNLTFDELSPNDKKKFFEYKFVIRLLPDIDEETIRNIFKRINKNNERLNQQELRQATYSGEFIIMINEIADRTYWEDIGLFTPQKIRRMLDSEFISELAIAFLNGHQNKKAKLDYYYKLYEEEFSEGDEVKHVFDSVIGEILQVLPNIKKTRWRNMTDFYTLFLVMAQYNNKVPFSSDIREKLNIVLIDFSNKVTNLQKAIKEDIASDEKDMNIRNYSSGIRASTDLGSRKLRFEALNNIIKSITV